MPYITEDDRSKFESPLDLLTEIIHKYGISNGELNYLITCLGMMYVARHGMSYNVGSDIIKAFECAKLEFYRRIMAPYEDKKIEQNGDVYIEG